MNTIRRAFQEFDKSVPRVDAAATKANKRAEDMKARGQACFKEWKKELALVHPEAASVIGPILIGTPYALSRALTSRLARGLARPPQRPPRPGAPGLRTEQE